ncbi:MAG: FkbM family methyltransferase [Isosphaeraceae bacterium]
MVKSLARRILFRGPSRRILSRPLLQPVWESLHKLSLYGMNYGGGNLVAGSGELWVMKWLWRRHEALRPGTPAVIFDVGAHNGSYSLSAVKIFGAEARIHSFEPSARVYESLRAATASHPNINAHNCGLSDRETTASLYYDAVGSQKASVHAEAYASPSDLARGRLTAEEIHLRTADAYCEEHGISWIDLLKIDVEGNELNVLRGASRMIDTGAVGAIQFEFGEAQIGSKTFFRDIHQFLSPQYKIHRILALGLSNPLETYDVILEVYRTTNYLAVLRDDIRR